MAKPTPKHRQPSQTPQTLQPKPSQQRHLPTTHQTIHRPNRHLTRPASKTTQTHRRTTNPEHDRQSPTTRQKQKIPQHSTKTTQNILQSQRLHRNKHTTNTINLRTHPVPKKIRVHPNQKRGPRDGQQRRITTRPSHHTRSLE